MYRDAGMFQVATDEAGRAVNEDYDNYSAHLFLANTYEGLDDPNGINLRYETPAEAEFLVANLLAPVNAGPLSATISQQEYSPLFEHNQVGVTSSTEYLSRGAWTESGAAYASSDTSSVDFESFYHSDPGQQTNSDFTQRQLSLQLKQKITARDTILVRAKEYESTSGDRVPIYNPDTADPFDRETEKQQPIAGIGYHHEWSPGIDTLFYATRIDDTYTLTNQGQPVIVAFRPSETNAPVGLGWDLVDIFNVNLGYADKLAIYSGEIQQVFALPEHTTVIGTRFQYGDFYTYDFENHPSDASILTDPSASQDVISLFRRISVYGYHQWQVADSLQLIGGLSVRYR